MQRQQDEATVNAAAIVLAAAARTTSSAGRLQLDDDDDHASCAATGCYMLYGFRNQDTSEETAWRCAHPETGKIFSSIYCRFCSRCHPVTRNPNLRRRLALFREKIPYLPSKFTLLPYLSLRKFSFSICR